MNNNQESFELKEKIKQLEKENNELKKNKIKYENEIRNIKIKINELNDKIYYNNKEIIELNKKLNQNNEEIKKFKSGEIFKQKGEKKIPLIFRSMDQFLDYTIFCDNTDNFSKVEQLLYEKFPEYKTNKIIFLCNGKAINRYKTIEENGLKHNSVILLSYNNSLIKSDYLKYMQ